MKEKHAKKIILDIGCGASKIKKAGTIGVDKEKLEGVDVVCDFAKKLPFKNNYADEIHCYHVIEHLHFPDNLMQEFYRVAKNGAFIYIKTPHYTGTAAWCDPTHVRALSLGFFENYERGWNYINKVKFQIVKKVIRWGGNYPVESWYPRYGVTKWYMKPPLLFTYYFFRVVCKLFPAFISERFCYLFGGCDEIEIIYQAKK